MCKKTCQVFNMLVFVFFYFSSVHMEESSVMQGAQGVLVQNWPTASSAAGKKYYNCSHINHKLVV